MELEIWDMLPAEQKYTYSQSSQIMGQTGCIGHLRGDMDTNGNGFFTSWTDHMAHLKTDAFKQEFDDVIHMLRFHPDYDHILKNRTSLAKYCYSHPSCQMEDGRSFGQLPFGLSCQMLLDRARTLCLAALFFSGYRTH